MHVIVRWVQVYTFIFVHWNFFFVKFRPQSVPPVAFHTVNSD